MHVNCDIYMGRLNRAIGCTNKVVIEHLATYLPSATTMPAPRTGQAKKAAQVKGGGVMGSANKMAKRQEEMLKRKNAKPQKTKHVDNNELEGADSGEE